MEAFQEIEGGPRVVAFVGVHDELGFWGLLRHGRYPPDVALDVAAHLDLDFGDAPAEDAAGGPSPRLGRHDRHGDLRADAASRASRPTPQGGIPLAPPG